MVYKIPVETTPSVINLTNENSDELDLHISWN